MTTPFSDSVRVLCPAKINTFLSVGPRDARGYHPIRTVFQAVSLFDELTIRIAERDRFESDLPLPERNTVTRAWALLGEYRTLPPLEVRLSKRIPSEAGLGGGSSDAAGFLRGAMALTGTRLEPAELRDLCLAVGADVPFFLVGGRAVGEGYGERLTPLPDPPETWAVVLMPNVRCSTAEMYRALDQKTYDWRELSTEESYNDFERVAPCECLEAIERLSVLGALRSGLSGSGAAVYGIFESRERAEDGRLGAAREGYEQSFLLKFLKRSESLALS